VARPASCQHPFPSSSYTDGSHRVALSRPESSEESAAPAQARANVPLHSIRRHAPAVSHTARVNWVLAKPISPHLISKRHRAGRARTRPASDLEAAFAPVGGQNIRLLTRVLVCLLDPLHGRSSGRSVRNPPHLTDADEWIDASDPGSLELTRVRNQRRTTRGVTCTRLRCLISPESSGWMRAPAGPGGGKKVTEGRAAVVVAARSLESLFASPCPATEGPDEERGPGPGEAGPVDSTCVGAVAGTRAT
jgi:hypothetical protein